MKVYWCTAGCSAVFVTHSSWCVEGREETLVGTFIYTLDQKLKGLERSEERRVGKECKA